MQLKDVKLSRGSMCNFGLRGRDGMLIKKDTGWLTDLEEIGSRLALPCPGNHQHEVCMGGNSKRAQIYTRQLAKAVVSGLVEAMQERGDERFLRQETSAKFNWACGSEFHEVISMDTSAWIAARSPIDGSNSEMMYDVLYLDINRDEESWRPLLQEAQVRLEGKVSNSAIVKTGSAFFAPIQDLVPWVIHQAQIVKSPKVRRIPQNLMSNKPITHRAAVLRYVDGHIGMETEQVKSFGNSRFEALGAKEMLRVRLERSGPPRPRYAPASHDDHARGGRWRRGRRGAATAGQPGAGQAIVDRSWEWPTGSR